MDTLRNRTELLTDAEAAHGKQLLANLEIESKAAVCHALHIRIARAP